MIHYIAILVPDRESGGYAVFFPDLPGCVTQGEDMADAQEMAVDALSLWMASAEEHRDKIPEPRELEAIRADRVFARDNEIDWKDATAVMIPVRPPLGRPERVNVSLDSNRLRAIDAYATRRGLTRSAVLEAGAELLIGRDPVAWRAEKQGGLLSDDQTAAYAHEKPRVHRNAAETRRGKNRERQPLVRDRKR
jgi:predicted RNase H-like HicB family nuclease